MEKDVASQKPALKLPQTNVAADEILSYADSQLCLCWSRRAIAAFILGLSSGPLAIGVFHLSHLILDGATMFRIAPPGSIAAVIVTLVWMVSLFAPFIIPAVLGLVAAGEINAARTLLRGKGLAYSGSLAAIVWPVGMLLYAAGHFMQGFH